MEILKAYRFFRILSRDERRDLSNIFLKEGYHPFNNYSSNTPDYSIMVIDTITELKIFTYGILTNETIKEKLFPYLLMSNDSYTAPNLKIYEILK